MLVTSISLSPAIPLGCGRSVHPLRSASTRCVLQQAGVRQHEHLADSGQVGQLLPGVARSGRERRRRRYAPGRPPGSRHPSVRQGRSASGPPAGGNPCEDLIEATQHPPDLTGVCQVHVTRVAIEGAASFAPLVPATIGREGPGGSRRRQGICWRNDWNRADACLARGRPGDGKSGGAADFGREALGGRQLRLGHPRTARRPRPPCASAGTVPEDVRRRRPKKEPGVSPPGES